MRMIKQIPEDFIVEEIPLHDFGGEGPYTYFLLEKKACNTEEAIQEPDLIVTGAPSGLPMYGSLNSFRDVETSEIERELTKILTQSE